MMKYFTSQERPFNSESNSGISEATALIKELADEHNIQIIDTTSWDDELRFKAYSDVITVAVIKQSAIRRIYGTNRHPGVNFGKQVPSLLIFDNDGHPIDAYPREVKGEVITILNFLQSWKGSSLG
jgi:hypothetical protein